MGQLTEKFSLGFLAGLLIGFVFMALSMRSYRKTLLLKAGPYSTPEKLPDGNFYYIVAEKQYNQLQQFRNKEKELIGYITTDSLGRLRQQLGNPTIKARPEQMWSCEKYPHRASVPVFIASQA